MENQDQLTHHGAPPERGEEQRANERLRFYSEAEKTLATSSALAAVSLDVRSVVEAVAKLAVNAFCDWCAIVLVQSDGTLAGEAGAHRDASKLETLRAVLEVPLAPNSPMIRVVASGNSIVVPHVRGEEMVGHLEAQTQHALLHILGMRSVMIVPLKARGTTMGAIGLVSADPERIFDQRDLRLAESFALRAALQIDNARLFERERQTSRELAFLSRVGEVLVSSLDLQTTLTAITQLLVPEFADWATISLLDEGGDIHTAALYHVDPTKADAVRRGLSSYKIDPNGTVGSAYAIRTGKPQISAHVDREAVDAFAQRSDHPERAASTLEQLGYHSSIAIPMQARGRIIGSIVAMWTTPDRTYTENDIPLFQEVARRSALAIQNAESFEREQRVARSLQRSFLPPSLPQLEGLQFDALYESGTTELEIGGDWYDAFALTDGRVIVAIGDVSGHGLEAAIVMAKAREMVRVLGVQGLAPDAILNVTNTTLKMEQRSLLVTALVAIIDTDRRRLWYASAGHPAALLLDADGSVVELARTGVPLGVPIETGPITAESVCIAAGSMLVLYTDGLTEATRDPLYGRDQLIAALHDPLTRTSASPARAIYDCVLAEHSRDDVAILTVRFQE